MRTWMVTLWHKSRDDQLQVLRTAEQAETAIGAIEAAGRRLRSSPGAEQCDIAAVDVKELKAE